MERSKWRHRRSLPAVDGDYFPAKMISKNLWIGSEGDSKDPSFYTRHNIRLVVNASRNIPFSSVATSNPDVRTYRVPVDDYPGENDTMLKHLPVVVMVIDEVLNYGHGVLVHCRAGMQRSAAVVAGYLMWKRGMTADQAFEFINRKKHETFYPRATFEEALRTWETVLRRTGRLR